MILGFKKQFEKPILMGTKIHTIREDKHNRWKPGNKIHFATGIRTKNYNQFYGAICISTQSVEILHSKSRVIIKIDDCFFGDIFYSGNTFDASNHIHRFVSHDGFQSVMSFVNFFNKDFSGKIIHWTDFKY